MQITEKKSIAILAGIMSIRMLGLFMILPVFAAYAAHMPGATPALIGLSLGIYGLSQALLQMPLGLLSDYIGRKPVIVVGLLLLLIGSLVAARAHSITPLLIGRALQGTGAIGSTVLALLTDLTREEFRSKAMAMMGLTIGLSFMIAMILGPVISAAFQLSGVFYASSLLAFVGLILLIALPSPPTVHAEFDNTLTPQRFTLVFQNKALWQLNIGVFSLHAILTAMFIAVPLVFFHQLQLTEWQQVTLYLSVLLLSFAGALPLIMLAEKKRMKSFIFNGSIFAIAAVDLLLSMMHHHLIITALLLLLFFTAFTVLEASLPALISKMAPIRYKGTAMGVYSASQFLGIFAGGALGGFVLLHAQISGVFLFCALIAAIWFCIARSFALRANSFL